MARLFDKTPTSHEAIIVASRPAAVSMAGANDASGTESALAMACAP
jgi:hypothetical protein